MHADKVLLLWHIDIYLLYRNCVKCISKVTATM